MNIIKFKDTKKDNDIVYETFRNQYCYAVSWKWAVCLEAVSIEKVKEWEQNNTEPDVTHIEISDYTDCIDFEVTEKINSVAKYIQYNNFTPATDITLNELKKFRTWLAHTLIEIEGDTKEYSEKVKQMLTYYAEGMYDSVILGLSNFPSSVTSATISTTSSSCACTQNAVILGNVTSACDPVATYRQAIYEFMVKTFRELDFWKSMEEEFLKEFKKYIDGIIAYNFPLYTSDYVSDFADCSCVNVANTAQELLMNILKNLSTSIEYIRTGNIDGHKNFINDSLYAWSSRLYEKMYWV